MVVKGIDRKNETRVAGAAAACARARFISFYFVCRSVSVFFSRQSLLDDLIVRHDLAFVL